MHLGAWLHCAAWILLTRHCSCWWPFPRGHWENPVCNHRPVPKHFDPGHCNEQGPQSGCPGHRELSSYRLVPLQVEFKLFGLIPGYVGLRGTFAPIEGSEETVEVKFEPPVLSFGDWATFRIGKETYHHLL
jgi:hypothetical protein